MLGKLFKHEWNSSWKIYGIINLYMVIVTVLCAITAMVIVKQEEPGEMTVVFATCTFLLFFGSLFGVSMAPNLYSAIRFYKNLYCNEGYLMHTLPVSKHSLILSKLFVAVIWMNITVVMEVISIITIIVSAISVVDTRYELWEEIRNAGPAMAEAQEYFGTPFWLLIVVSILIAIVGSFVGTLMFYACISLGQLVKRFKILMSIAVYIAIQCITQMVGSIMQIPFSVGMEMLMMENRLSVEGMMWGTLGIGLAGNLIMIAVYYLICYLVMKKKVNLD